MRAAVFLGLMLATTPAQTGVVQGTVVCEGTSEPVPGVEITVGSELRAVTDNAGRFVVQNAPAGSTSVRAQREGYFGQAIDGDFPSSATTPVVVKTSEAANIRITLGRAGSVSGKVFDSNGKPMYDSVVGILRVVYTRGVRTVDVIEAKSSGKSGEYRLYPVPPGEYVVGAAPSSETQVTTLYPSTTNLDSASRIFVKAAEEVRGVDIYTQRGKWVTSPSLK
jgi:hypothetical protein